MRLSVLVLTVSVVLSGQPAQSPQKAEEPLRETFNRLEKMSFAEQQAWLRHLEERAARAARLTLPPEEAARWQAHIRSLLHRQLITWSVLREAIELTEARERAARELEKRERLSSAEDQAKELLRLQDEEVLRSLNWLQQRLESVVEKVHTEVLSPAKEGTAALPVLKELSERLENFLTKMTPLTEEPLSLPALVQKKLLSLPTPMEQIAIEGELPKVVEVNVEELAARIAGCNMAFRLLEGELDEQGRWNAPRLEPLLERLSILLIRRSDLELFRELVPEEERRGLARLVSPKPVIEQFRVRLAEARRASAASADEQPSEQNESSRLEALARRLAEITEKQAERQ